MDLTNSLPVWILISCVILWGLTIILFVLFRVARRRALHRKDSEFHQMAYQGQATASFNSQMHNELLSQQVDTVFNAMSTVIATERLKLKALLGYPACENERVVVPTLQSVEPTPMACPAPTIDDEDMGSLVAQLAGQGLNQEQIAGQLGVSQSEVALASRMMARQVTREPARLNAVA